MSLQGKLHTTVANKFKPVGLLTWFACVLITCTRYHTTICLYVNAAMKRLTDASCFLFVRRVCSLWRQWWVRTTWTNSVVASAGRFVGRSPDVADCCQQQRTLCSRWNRCSSSKANRSEVLSGHLWNKCSNIRPGLARPFTHSYKLHFYMQQHWYSSKILAALLIALASL